MVLNCFDTIELILSDLCDIGTGSRDKLRKFGNVTAVVILKLRILQFSFFWEFWYVLKTMSERRRIL